MARMMVLRIGENSILQQKAGNLKLISNKCASERRYFAFIAP
jgi:hypothetical protein